VSVAIQRGLAPIAAARGVGIATVAVAWALNRPAVSAIVVGASHPQQTRANAEIADFKLDPDEVELAFDDLALDPNGRGRAGR